MRHPTTRILTCSYDLCDGQGIRRWQPGKPLPVDLFRHVMQPGATLEAHNAMFERMAVECVATPLYGWPAFPIEIWRCSMATAHVDQYPGALGKLGDVLGLTETKDRRGEQLIKRFCIPQQPVPALIDKRTGRVKREASTRMWVEPEDDPAGFEELCAYCDQDVRTEQAASDRMVPMTSDEMSFWQIDQEVNHRGLGVDLDGVHACVTVLDAVLERYGQECRDLTGFNVTQLEKLKGWLGAHECYVSSLDAASLEVTLGRPDLHPAARRVLELRQLTGSASVKKTYALASMTCDDGRLRNTIVHHKARTGRPGGADVQPLNLPKAGPKLVECGECGRPYRVQPICPWCGECGRPDARGSWRAEHTDPVLDVMRTGSLDMVEHFFGDALLCISGCVRGLFVASGGNDLIASDYSAIEAVVAAELAGETWRQEAFRRRDPIYLVSASKITGTPLETYLAYHEQHGEHHPDRQKIGKVAELAGSYGGYIGSYRAFGAEGTDDEIKATCLAWRAASPAIVEMWGGQYRGLPWDRFKRPELYGIEGMAIAAVQSPGTRHTYRSVTFERVDGPDRLLVTLPSGRQLTYHEPMLTPGKGWAKDELGLSYMTWNSNPKYGAMGWVRMETYGARCFENCVQAVAHDIQRYGIRLLRDAGYPLVLGVYDEDVVEVPQGFGSVEEVERLMSTMPAWAEGWPIYATGGWRGRRYRKG
jgi:DNA polymerase